LSQHHVFVILSVFHQKLKILACFKVFIDKLVNIWHKFFGNFDSCSKITDGLIFTDMAHTVSKFVSTDIKDKFSN